MSNTLLPNHKGFLVRLNGRGLISGRSHLWTGSDTVCRLWSTGLSESSKTYRVTDEPLTQLCSLCHPERHDLELWVREAVAAASERPYTLRS